MEGHQSLISAAGNNSIEDDEFAWDGFFHVEQLKTVPENDDYENLMIAARAGQKLLQRNGELRNMNYQLQYCNEEQRVEIEHLTKQLAWLREVKESKARMFEQLDFNHQELEATNMKLKAETKEWRERLSKYMNLCENREDEIQSLKDEIKALHKAQEKKVVMNLRRRTIHGCLPFVKKDEIKFHPLTSSFSRSSEILNLDASRDKSFSIYQEEVGTLQQVIKDLKSEQSAANRKHDELQEEVNALLLEIQDCCMKLLEEREMTKKLKNIIEEYDKIVYHQAFDTKSRQNFTFDLSNDEIYIPNDATDKDTEPENMVNPQSIPEADTTVSIDMIPTLHYDVPLSQYLRITSSTPARPSPLQLRSKSYFVTPMKSSFQVEPKSEPRNVSLVQEMDTQYKSLLGKYETLLKTIESERCSDSTNESQQDMQLRASSKCPSSSDTSSKDHDDKNLSKSDNTASIPEYKRLFREIFTLINEARYE